MTSSLRVKKDSELQKDFIGNQIIKLEARQVAESITKIVNIRKIKQATYEYLIFFEESLNQNGLWINEQELNSLDVLREQSLCSFYSIGQKT